MKRKKDIKIIVSHSPDAKKWEEYQKLAIKIAMRIAAEEFAIKHSTDYKNTNLQ